MLEIVPYELDEIKNLLKVKAITEFGLNDAEFEGSHVSQLINLLAYATVINNTNFTFGLNEMFITQAKDRRNVIKHARQMGYTHKRNVSYQYKIKLQVLGSGLVTLNKYSTFSSDGNSYIYLGSSIAEVYGTYTFLKLLSNEYNNNKVGLYLTTALTPSKFIITEEDVVCRILVKEVEGQPKFLLESMDASIKIPEYSQLGQEVYVQDGLDSVYGSMNQGYRNFTTIGTVDTFVLDEETSLFRVQITLNNEVQFPFPIIQSQSAELADLETVNIEVIDGLYVLNKETTYLIESVEELIIVDGTEEIYVPLNSIVIDDKNIAVTLNIADVIEEHISTGILETDAVTFAVDITTNHDMILDSLTEVTVERDLGVYTLLPVDLVIDYVTNIISIPAKIDTILYIGDTGVDAVSTITLPETSVVTVNSIILKDIEGTIQDWETAGYTYTLTGSVITFQINDIDTDLLNGYTAEVDYDYYDKTIDNTITLKYSYNIDINGKEAKLNYKYTINERGLLAKRLFFSDFKGEIKENENQYNPLLYPEGWEGFYASDFNEETNVLYFPIGEAPIEDVNSELTSGNSFHNPYVSIDGVTESLETIMTTPFRRTRFSVSGEIWNESNTELIGYLPYDRDTTFASILSTSIKDELEIIVKEGTIKRWNDQTEKSIEAILEATNNGQTLPTPVYENPELTVIVNSSMVEAGYFSIRDEFIEDQGIELFITRVLPDGTVEYDELWTQRNYLLAEETETDFKSFVSMSDVNYEDYINIYTRYAGTGTPLTLDMTARLNILTSNGPEGITNSLIVPDDSDSFAPKYYIEETLTPVVLHIEGSEIMDTDTIRETAPLFSNTANRAVTKQDYKTICEAQPYIQNAQVWGGEEETPVHIPGHIFFSLIPHSRPTIFDSTNSAFLLRNVENSELFFTSYYQITGKEKYESATNKEDKEVLFNLLNNYKIITLQLNYIKPIYMDYNVDVEVLKYRFGQTIEETNKEIFDNVIKYFVREIESFDSIFYSSSLSRYIDEELGDKYGISLNTSFSVDLYDSLYDPDKGTFVNASKLDLNPDDTSGLVGDDDLWKFIMPIDIPIEDLFEDNIIVDGLIEYRGRMVIDHITNCNTYSFVVPEDLLYMELDDGTFVSHDTNGIEEEILANAFSEVIEINIIYVRNWGMAKLFSDGEINSETGVAYTEEEAIAGGGERYKVGSYFIHRNEQIIRLELNTHSYWHIDSLAIVTQTMIEDGDTYWEGAVEYIYLSVDLDKNIFYQVDATGDIIREAVLDTEGTPVVDELGDPVLINKQSLSEQDVDNLGTDIFNIPMPYTDTLSKTMLIDSEGFELYNITSAPLPREFFTEETRTMSIKPKGSNIKSRRNIFSRLKSLNFIS